VSDDPKPFTVIDLNTTAGVYDREARAYLMRHPAPTIPDVVVRRILERNPGSRREPPTERQVWEYDVACPHGCHGLIHFRWMEVVPMDLIGYERDRASRERYEQQRRHEAEVARLTAALELANRERAALRSKVVKQAHRRSKRDRGY
jgi:hypothetical protein